MSQVRVMDSRVPQTKGETVLEVTSLRVQFYRRRRKVAASNKINAVDDVSFKVFRSESVSLVGESGSGKTTIARSIVRLTRPASGSIKYNGVDVWKLKGKDLKKYRREVQIIYQDPYESLNPRETILKAIGRPIQHLAGEKDRRIVEERVRNLLSEVELDPETTLNRLPHQLSGGERQRVNIARALACEPKFLIADEPITMLDAAQRLNVLSLLMRLKASRDLTLLIITHDLASAKLTSNRIMVMYLGKLVEIGSSDSVFLNPHHPYLELILRATPDIRSPVTSFEDNLLLQREVVGQQPLGSRCVFVPRCSYATKICEEVEPKLEEKSESHLAACHNPLNVAR